ncbi:MAG: extracellular solute-binding protein [Parachlamydia sp.]|nr:extracellular solute-binding protein [Parachlamydia sp.]
MSIHLWLSLQGPVYDYLQQTVGEWNKQHQESQVELKNIAGGYDRAVVEALNTPESAQPALVLAPEYTSSLIGALGERKVVPICDILHQEQLNKIAEIVRRTFGDASGRVVSLPFNPACGILYINRDALNAIGKHPEYVPSTLQELEEVSRELVGKKIVPYGYTCAWSAAYLLEVPAAQCDLPLIVPDNGFQGYGQFQLNRFKDHFLRLRQQVRERILFFTSKNEDAHNAFLEKKVAFFEQGSSHFKRLQGQAKFQIGYGAIPNLTHGQKFAFPLGGGSIWVLNSHETQKMKEGVRAFLNYLASDEVQQKLHEETASVPVSKTLPPKLEEFYKTHPVHKAVVVQTVEALLGKHSFGIHMHGYADTRKALFELIEEILNLDKTPDAKVPELLKTFDQKFSKEKP